MIFLIKTIKELIDKIKWDKRENPEDYEIGYWDRIEQRIIKIPLNKFLQKDIPFHRVRVVEKRGKKVWMRTGRNWG